MKLKKDNAPEQLLVEGPNDLHVIANMWRASRGEEPRQRFFIKEQGGFEKLRKRLPAILTRDNPGPVGIVVDADSSFADRWRSLQTALGSLGYAMPTNMNVEGLIIPHEQLPRVGVWIWPNNQSEGMLEDFLRELIGPEDDLIPEVESCLARLAEGGRQRFPDLSRPKAFIHTWLAWQRQPGSPYGIAIKSHYLDFDHPLSQRLIAWLNRLFLPSDL